MIHLYIYPQADNRFTGGCSSIPKQLKEQRNGWEERSRWMINNIHGFFFPSIDMS